MEDNKDEIKINKQKQEEEIQEKKINENKKDVKKDFQGFFQSLKEFLGELLNIKAGTDRDATAEIIKAGISIKGHTAWILVFSILVASIGLNVSSTAVVIGAMLISPLMGPILGVGFSIGINDIDTLRLSMINLGVMVALSITTSFLFFSIPIFQDATPEILARTKPDVRDVLIAISGGLALIIAISRPKAQFNTVAGVAIATALMPPLCTAGFGLATGQFNYFGGAIFLFTINSIFIALAAFSITKFLNFPMLKYINQEKRKRISQVASLVALVIFSFSIYLFYQLYKQNDYTMAAEKYIESIKKEGVNIIGDPKKSVNYNKKEIKLFIFGGYTGRDKERWEQNKLDAGLADTKLIIVKSQDESSIRKDIDKIEALYKGSHEVISARDETIKDKDFRIRELEKDLRIYYDNEIEFETIAEEIRINYTDLDKVSFAKEYITNLKKVDSISTALSIDTIPIISVAWNQSLSKKKKKIEEIKLQKWLQTRLNMKYIDIRPLTELDTMGLH